MHIYIYIHKYIYIYMHVYIYICIKGGQRPPRPGGLFPQGVPGFGGVPDIKKDPNKGI